MDIRLANTDTEIMTCYAVMRELRPHIDEDVFVPQVRRQQESGYQLAYIDSTDGVMAVAGFRIAENLAWGRFLYVDDLVTVADQRSHGYGRALLGWLRDYAAAQGCGQLHLDSGLQRQAAHRFYEREGMTKAGYHFVKAV